MLIFHGRRTARIKRFTDNQQSCKTCGAFDLDIRVYRDYYHIFFIPVLPIGEKTTKIKCNNCGAPFRSDTLQKHYESLSKTPIYLYIIPGLFCGLLAILIIGNLNTQKEKATFVDNPKVGDVYLIRKDENNSTTYFFLRLVNIRDDTIVTYHNNLVYNSFITKFNNDDFFVKGDELFFTKSELKQMLDKMEINSVERDYGDNEGFNRIK